jgi:hypothetical protein
MWAYRFGLSCMLLASCVFSDRDDRDDRSDEASDRRDARSSESQAARDATRPMPAGEFCEQWARAACSEAVVSACQASDTAECEATQAEFCRGLAPEELASAGRNECLAGVASAYRDADLEGDELALVLRFRGACARTVVGTAAENDDCESSSDCDAARGFSCVRKADTGAGTCQVAEVVEPGRDCRDAAKTCQDGFFCDGRNCIETLATEEPCLVHEQCGQDGFCDAGGKCAERRAVNDSCEADDECARGICSELGDEKVCTDRVLLSRADPLCANLR